jgi:predicted DCC family thiol-disulfide oxidoreductase YuxK
VLAVANQKEGVLSRYGLTREQVDRSAWTIERDGRRSQGAAAVNRVLRALEQPWSTLAAVYGVPPLGAAEETCYGWFARNRSRFHRFGVRPECDEPGADCA